GRAGKVDAARAVLNPEQDIQRPQPDGLDGEEVAGQDPLRLRTDKLGPGRTGSSWRRPKPTLPKQHADRGRTDPDPELAQLALDPDAAPGRVLPRQPQHQLP